MVRATRQLLTEYRSATTKIAEIASKDFTSEWASIFDPDFEVVRKNLYEFYPAKVKQYGLATSRLSSSTYSAMRVQSGTTGLYRPVLASLPDAAVLKSDVDYTVGFFFNNIDKPDNAATALGKIRGNLVERSLQMGRATMYENVRIDGKTNGTHVYWAIFPAPNCCDWCQAKGDSFRYWSDDTALDTFHRDCRCDVGPQFE